MERQHVTTQLAGRSVKRSLVGRVTGPLPASPEAIPLASELRHLFGDPLIVGREPVSYTHLDVYKRQTVNCK